MYAYETLHAKCPLKLNCQGQRKQILACTHLVINFLALLSLMAIFLGWCTIPRRISASKLVLIKVGVAQIKLN